MNKQELVNAVADRTEISKKNSDSIIGAVFDVITEALGKGEKVVLPGFGTFQVKDRAARVGRNPQTGDEIQIPATRVPVFSAGKPLKNSITG